MLRLRLGPAAALEIPGEGPPLGEDAGWPRRFGRPPPTELLLAVFLSEGCHVCRGLEPAIEALAADPVLSVAGLRRGRRRRGLAASWTSPAAPTPRPSTSTGSVLAKGSFNNLAQLESVLATAERRRGRRGADPAAPCVSRRPAGRGAGADRAAGAGQLAPRLPLAGRQGAARAGRRPGRGRGDRAGGARGLPLLRPHLHDRLLPAPDRTAAGRFPRPPAAGPRRRPGRQPRAADQRPGPAARRGRRLLRDLDGQPLPPAPRTPVCEEAGRRFGFYTQLDGSWYRCCGGHVRKLMDCCAYSQPRINGDAALPATATGPQGLLRHVPPDEGAHAERGRAGARRASSIGLTGAWSPCGLSMVETIGPTGHTGGRRTTFAALATLRPRGAARRRRDLRRARRCVGCAPARRRGPGRLRRRRRDRPARGASPRRGACGSCPRSGARSPSTGGG